MQFQISSQLRPVYPGPKFDRIAELSQNGAVVFSATVKTKHVKFIRKSECGECNRAKKVLEILTRLRVKMGLKTGKGVTFYCFKKRDKKNMPGFFLLAHLNFNVQDFGTVFI